jgi:hypothetical protein
LNVIVVLMRPKARLFLFLAACSPAPLLAQTAPPAFSEADHLRGGYGPYRANLYYINVSKQ